MLYAKWEGPLRQARQETDHQELLRLAGEAELALFQRFQELPVNAAGHQETLAILAACEELLQIKITSEWLGWPGLAAMPEGAPN